MWSQLLESESVGSRGWGLELILFITFIWWWAGERMPSAHKMDRIAWWESEILSLQKLRKKLEWKPFWL